MTQEILLEEIQALLRELHPNSPHIPEVRLDKRLDRELGLDSLSRMELLARLEGRFQVSIPTQAGVEATTPGELMSALMDAKPRLTKLDVASNIAFRPKDRLELPTDARTLPEVLAWHAQHHGAQMHVHFADGDPDGREWTYGGLWEASGQLAAGLQERGLRSGDTVALMYPTHPDLLVSFFGVMRAGGVPVPLYPPSRPNELAEFWRRQSGILRNCGARMMLISDSMAEHRHLLGAMTGSVEQLATASELMRLARQPEPVALDNRDLALLQYTSGSTADPKGVMLTHGNLLSNIRAMGQAVHIAATDVFVSWLPLYHDMGLIGAWLGCLYFGIPLILMPPQAFLIRPERWLWAIHRYGATLSAAPNFAYELCLHRIADPDIEGLDLSRLRLAFCGAEPVSRDTMARFADRFERLGFHREALFPVYGLAENTLAVTFPPTGRGLKVLDIERDRFLHTGEALPCHDKTTPSLSFVSCGVPLPAHEVRVVDESESEMPDGRQGRLEFRGPSATSGYYRKPELTQALIRGGWLDTGDLGFIYDGELYLTGRSKDIIIRAGRHLHPQNIEQEVGDVAGVRRGRVAAFGTTAQGTEQLVIVAETRLRDGKARDALRIAIDGAVQRQVGEPADEIVLAPPGTVLKTSSGKLRRAACRAAYESGQLGAPDRTRLLAVVCRSLWSRLKQRLRRMAALLYAAYAWSVVSIMAVVAACGIAMLPTLKARWRFVQGLLGATAFATRVRLNRDVREPPPPETCIFIANHSSNLDALAAIWALPRPVSIVAKQELSDWWLMRWLLQRLDVVFVDREDFQKATGIVREVQSKRRDLLFFPEGTFRRMPGLLPFRLGAFLVASEAGMPIVPLVLRGTRDVLRGDDRLPRTGAISVRIEPPLRPHKTPDPWHEALRLSSATRAIYLEHSGEPDMGESALEAP